MTDHKTDVSGPSEAEVKAARIALSKLCADGCEVEGDVRCCADPPCPCAKFARAVLTAAAHVRPDFKAKWIAAAEAAVRRQEEIVRLQAALDEACDIAFGTELNRVAVDRLRVLQKMTSAIATSSLMPIYGATEDKAEASATYRDIARDQVSAANAPDQGEDVLGMKGEG